jgi:hypothetical protein
MGNARIGFVGIGLMGHGIAKNLVTKGFPLTVRVNRNRKPLADLLAAGAKEVATNADVARDADIVFLCVTGAPQVDAMIVVGAPNSSNSLRLREVAQRSGCRTSALVQRAADIDWPAFANIKSLGLTAGASAPEVLVDEIIDAFALNYRVSVENISGPAEDIFFPLPRELRNDAGE